MADNGVLVNDVVVAAAQSASRRGDLDANISTHVRLIGVAASVGVNLIVFPELSLTGYELDLAGELRLETNDPRLEPLRKAAASQDMHILAGGPWASDTDTPYLGAFLISPERSTGYAKIHVHESEAPYFAAGKEGCVVSIGGIPTGLAICADTTHPSHAAEAAERGAQLYVASVMKTEAEYPAFADRLAGYAARHHMAVMAANYAGSTGGAVSAGKSAFWDQRGELIGRADSNRETLVVARRCDGEWRADIITNP